MNTAGTHSNGAPFLDAATVAALQLPDLWENLQPVTAYGHRWKHHLRPYLPGQEAHLTAELGQLRRDAQSISEATADRHREWLAGLVDIHPVLSSLAAGCNSVSSKEALLLKQFALHLRHGLQQSQNLCDSSLWDISVDDVAAVLHPFRETEEPGFSVAHLADAAYRQTAERLAEARRARWQALQAESQKFAAIHPALRMLASGEVVLSLPEGRAVVPKLEVRTDLVKQSETPVAVRYDSIPGPHLVEVSRRFEAYEGQLEAEGERLLQALAAQLRRDLLIWQRLVLAVTAIDARLSKVVLLHAWDGCVPELGEADLHVVAGVHPQIRQRFRQQRQKQCFVPIDFDSDGARVHAIAGSNMGGKTVAMSVLLLAQIFFQYALPVPAKAFSSRLFGCVRFAAPPDTDIRHGLSSFGQEIVRLRAVWRDATSYAPALMAFDEPGRSTNPREGEALVMGLLSAAQSAEDGRMVLFATHFAQPTLREDIAHWRVQGLRARTDEMPARKEQAALSETEDEARMALLEQWMDYRLKRSQPGEWRAEAVPIARLLGLPDVILEYTEEYLSSHSNGEEGTHR
ncbi:MAG: hypothetical protein OWS03_01255 [Alicyclobacillaceae bacterium]|nr:hypothetical protein [Alicyclobacillaceae bacterium]